VSGLAAEIMRHELVPKHEILDKSEVEKLLAKLGVPAVKLPKILESDPAVKAIGAKQGQVLKITRKSPTAGQALYYRLVISG